MSFFKPVATAEAVKEQTGGSYINDSGIYDVTLKIVSVKVNEHNARSLNFNVDYNGTPTTFYGLKLDNNDGTPNFQQSIFNKLCIIAGLDAVSDPEIQEHRLGKDGTLTELAVLPDFTDLPVKVRVQKEYRKYNDKISRSFVIRNFYREDGASASEIINGTEIGAQLKKDEPYASNVTYRDCTPEEVAAWEAAQKAGSAPVATPKATTTAAPAANLFA